VHHKVENLSRDSINHLPSGLSHHHLSNGHIKNTSHDSISSMRRKEFEQQWTLLNENRCHCCQVAQTVDEHMSRLIDSQSCLLNSVNSLVRQTNSKEKLNESKKEWIIAASIVDQTCFVIFLVMLFSSTVIIFTQAY